MQALVLSDLHFEFHRDSGLSFVEGLPITGVDLAVLAGDIAVGDAIPAALALFCERYPRVVYVHGNHEFYQCSRADVLRATEAAVRRHTNLHWLDCDTVEIEGVRIHGAPLWFRPGADEAKPGMTDFRAIADFESWVYAENERALSYFDRSVLPGEVVVTHHLPSTRSVAAEYTHSSLNAFFVCNVESLIANACPAIWVHGHTHSSLDYVLAETRVICNPFGYARQQENPSFRDRCLVTLG